MRSAGLSQDLGYCPLSDHGIVPQTSLADYRYYLRRLSEIRLS